MSKRNRERRATRRAETGGLPEEAWTPFQEATYDPVQHAANVTFFGLNDRTPQKVFKNNLYTVAMFLHHPGDGWPLMIHLSIKRNDKGPARDWRHMQRIKNELVGAEHEAVELYPAESRLVDGANQFHLFALAAVGIRFPFGFQTRMVTESKEGNVRQRPFRDAPPADLAEQELAYQETLARFREGPPRDIVTQ